MLLKFDELGYEKIKFLLNVGASFSECTRMGVCVLGCEIVEDFINIRHIAINSPRMKSKCTGEKGRCGCLHAEEAMSYENQYELVISTHSTCPKCYAEFLDRAGVKKKLREGGMGDGQGASLPGPIPK